MKLKSGAKQNIKVNNTHKAVHSNNRFDMYMYEFWKVLIVCFVNNLLITYSLNQTAQ